ncbi:MAG TPA: carboxylesterase/lipase family protein [Candidatus Acidoferrum sp.]|nr:carboxylesterase/lipase family protein [Candidatus Acidoferrum sp.]
MKHLALSLVFLSFAFALMSATPAGGQAEPVVKTGSGAVRGKLSEDGKIAEFLGIPYAVPPVGSLRWKAPQPVAAWTGVRDATSFGARCMQLPLYSDMVFRDAGMSEDCLTLNIWVPTGSGGTKLPVMVWVYGGGFQAGGTSEPRQDGENLAHKGVIVVSMNYRLGVFGFLATHALAKEFHPHSSGNYGLLDQSAALRWVQKNIAAFGGDPHNITIFGESAGSFSVNMLMASPLSRDIPAHAIGESGAANGKSSLPLLTLAMAEHQGEQFAKNVLHATTPAELRAIPAEEILKKLPQDFAPSGLHFTPIVDGYFLPKSVAAIYAAGEQARIPLLAGWNRNENDMSPDEARGFTAEKLQTLAAQRFGANAVEFLKLYPAVNDAEALQSANDLSGDTFIAYGTWSWLEAQVRTGDAPVYRYRFDLAVPSNSVSPQVHGAYHSDEIEYVFGTLDSRKGFAWRPEDYQLSELMQTYWTNFARTGDPNGSGLPTWPTYSPKDNWQVMHLSHPAAAAPDQWRDRYLFLQSVWGK